ncbi:hypothetical protein [Actibacterium sp. 188UL27-1]|uniref:DUF6630 family protein n=1 Tax=Actibacterium sp. 188UL27-1 TaxID=2786961 RepID=UPI00195B9B99|nr:hypothetical protein [Actibacterium sp. 188UL27-1]MBM7067629.1 hypothetical protein [Actibacterium sp. 188UL27-1]
MLRLLQSGLVALGLISAAGSGAAKEAAQSTVMRFARAFLGEAAVARLSDPAATGYEALDMMEVDLDSTRPDQFEDGIWGQILISEMLDHSEMAIWLDWKFNVLTMVNDDDWDDQLGTLFSLYGVAPLTDNERTEVLAKAQAAYGDRPEVMMFPDLQPLAERRGYRLMVFENQSDGMALFMVPLEEAEAWHLTHLGHVLIIDAAAGIVADPRSGGRPRLLTN